jgi:hypothetical protein
MSVATYVDGYQLYLGSEFIALTDVCLRAVRD